MLRRSFDPVLRYYSSIEKEKDKKKTNKKRNEKETRKTYRRWYYTTNTKRCPYRYFRVMPSISVSGHPIPKYQVSRTSANKYTKNKRPRNFSRLTRVIVKIIANDLKVSWTELPADRSSKNSRTRRRTWRMRVEECRTGKLEPWDTVRMAC